MAQKREKKRKGNKHNRDVRRKRKYERTNRVTVRGTAGRATARGDGLRTLGVRTVEGGRALMPLPPSAPYRQPRLRPSIVQLIPSRYATPSTTSSKSTIWT